MDKALHKIIDASFTGPDGLDYVETEVALNVARSISNWTPVSISKWTSVENQLPEENKWVMVTEKYFNYFLNSIIYDITISKIDKGVWINEHFTPINVVAWQPLPEPYKESEDEE